MNFQQLRSVRETARSGFNLTEVAAMLYTSQPGVSRQIRELEDELGVTIFERAGKRLTGLTAPGKTLLPIVERLLQEADNLRQAGKEFVARMEGGLSIAATHSQARYALPHAVRDFRALFPQVTLNLHQGSPKQVAEMLIAGEADIGIATEALASYPQLVTLPCYRWTHSIVVPPGHPLLESSDQHGLVPNVVITAMDADVIKTYVELGMGVGIVASIAVDAERDRHLRALDARHLFEINVTRLAVRRGTWLRGYAYSFIENFAPSLTRQMVEEALSDELLTV
jgi:LysR family cys regulon transcriptional activator